MGTSFRRVLLAVTVPSVALFTLASCGVSPRHTISSSSAAEQISSKLRALYGVAPLVNCPANLPDQQGRTFTCHAELDGQGFAILAVVTGGGKFSATPQSAIVVAKSVESELASSIAAANRSEPSAVPTVSCAGPPVIVRLVGGTFICQATFPGQAARQVTVTVENLSGTFHYQLSPPG